MLDLLTLFAIIAFVAWLVRRRLGRGQEMLPASAPRGDATAGRFEAIALGGLSASMLVMLAMYRAYNGVPEALRDDVRPSARGEYWMALAISIAIIVAALVLAWFRRGGIAALVLGIFFTVAGWAVNSGAVFSYHGHEKEISAMPVPLRIELSNGIAGADVWLNGVHVGKTPIEANVDDVLARLPNWTYEDARANDADNRSPANPGFVRTAGTLIIPPNRVNIETDSEPYRHIFAKVDLQDRPMQVSGVSATGGSRMFGHIQRAHIVIDAILPEWSDEVRQLADRARLSDYQIDPAWAEAAASYLPFSWNQLRSLSQEEPGFDDVLDQWAGIQFGIKSDLDTESARAAFERLQEHANAQGEYDSDSLLGRAVDLLVPKLSPTDLVDRAEELIGDPRKLPNLNVTYGEQLGRLHIGTGNDDQSFRTPGDILLAHAIWRLDELMDQQDDSADNLVEQRITPALLRLDSGKGMAFRAATILGGSICDDFVLRHDVRKSVEFGRSPFEDYVRIGNLTINNWLILAASIPSPAGSHFRKTHSEEILRVAEQITSDRFSTGESMVENIGFLFLDSGPRNLAERFWPTFDRLADKELNEGPWALRARWGYLIRMQPRSTPEQFVSSYNRTAREWIDEDVLSQLEPDLQFEVFAALIENLRERLEPLDRKSQEYIMQRPDLEDLEQRQMMIPHQKAADVFLVWATEPADDHGKRIRTIEQWTESGRLPQQQLNALSTADDAELRRLVVAAVAQRPTPERRELLARLLNDPDEETREEAAKVQSGLDELKVRPLSARGDRGDVQPRVAID